MACGEDRLMFERFTEQLKAQSKKAEMSLTSISIDMGFSSYTLPAAFRKKWYSVNLMICVADYFKKDIIYRDGQFQMIERKVRK